MVNRNEVVAVADRLHAAGEPVSVRTVRDGLRRGGSFGDVGPLVAAWKLANNWRARPVPGDMPVALQDLMERFGAELWAKAKEIAKGELANERDAVEARRQADLEVGADIGMAADALERRVRELEARSRASEKAHRETVARLKADLEMARSVPPARQDVSKAGPEADAPSVAGDAGPDRSQDAFGQAGASDAAQPSQGPGCAPDPVGAPETSRRFWDRVMREAAEILWGMQPRRASADALYDRLDVATLVKANAFQSLDARLLARKMAVRAGLGKYFLRHDDGTFELLDHYVRSRTPA